MTNTRKAYEYGVSVGKKRVKYDPKFTFSTLEEQLEYYKGIAENSSSIKTKDVVTQLTKLTEKTLARV